LESYSIKQIEQLTGIKAHTIRIWEKRYRTLVPHRTATGIRYYDDEQLRKMLNISVLLQQGNKISTLMSLPDEKINEMILEQVSQQQSTNIYGTYINSLISSMLSYDELLFDKVFSTIFIRFGVYDSMINVVYPFLKITGILWSTKNATPGQEHFASNIVKRKLLVAIDAIPVPKNSTKKFILFLPPGEWHDTGLNFSDYVIRNAGIETINLGQSVPYASLESCIQRVNPDYLLTFFTSGTDFTEAITYLKELATSNPIISILISNSIPNNYGQVPSNVSFLGDPTTIFDYLH
jgi:methanogenic corrinoid protein MtbC1